MGLKSTLKKVRNQKAIYWANTGSDQYGDNTYAEPVEIDCRWDDHIGEVAGASITTAKGEIIQTRAIVIVDRDMQLGDRLKLGELESGTPDSPIDDVAAWPIVGFAKNPDLKAKEFVRRAYL